MAHRVERYDRYFVCDDYRDDPSAGYGRLCTVSIKGNWRCARIHSDRWIDLLARSFEREIGRKISNWRSAFSAIQRDRPAFHGLKAQAELWMTLCEGNSQFNGRASAWLKRNRKSA